MIEPDKAAVLQGRERELVLLRALAGRFPNVDAAMAAIARLSAILTLPKGTNPVISDIHGEDQKLRHVINGAHRRSDFPQAPAP
jgi:fructose-1,6-bisphosphatase-3